MSAVGRFAVTDAEQLMAQAFESFQVTLGYCLLMEFSAWVAVAPKQLQGAWFHLRVGLLARMCKIQRLLYA